MSSCVFAGTFDPLTLGHINVINKALKAFERVYVVVGENPKKSPTFTQEQRLNIIKAAFSGEPGVAVSAYSDYSDYAKYLRDNGIFAYVRGIRDAVDFQFEQAYERINQELYPDIVTVYISADEELVKISSSLVKERLAAGEDFSGLVHESTVELIKGYLKQK